MIPQQKERKNMKYFIHDPEYGTNFFENELDFLKALRELDLYQRYCDEQWNMDVENVIAGKLKGDINPNPEYFEKAGIDEYDFYMKHATHQATENVLKNRPEDHEINAEGQCEDGFYWGDFDYITDYSFELIPQPKHERAAKCL